MRFNFKKVSAIATSALMLGMTVGVAAAANYPAPFTTDGVAIVYGTGTGVSILDQTQAYEINFDLTAKGGTTTSTTSSVSGGDSVKLEKSSTKFQLGNGISDVISTSITDDSPNNGLPTLLKDGNYVDDDNDEFDYVQKIDLANLTLNMFEDNDYKEDVPTVGIKIANGNYVLNYTLDFTDEPLWTDLTSTNIEMLGKEYFILSTTPNTTINLLDSATTTTLQQGESTTMTIEGTSYDVILDFVGSSTAKFTVNGEKTNSLSAGDTQKVSGIYIGIKSIDSQDYAEGLKQVEFSLGAGKLELKHATDIVMNDDTISDIKAYFSTDSQYGKLQKIVIEWKAEDDLFATPDSEVTMPGFNAVKLTTAGMHYAAEETISIKGASDYLSLKVPIKNAEVTIPLLYGNDTGFTGIGKDANSKTITKVDDSLIFDSDTDDYFIVSYNDGSNAESYLMRATSFSTANSGAINKTTFQYADDNSDTGWSDAKTDATYDGSTSDTVNIGNVALTVNAINKNAKTVNVTAGTNVKFHVLYSKEGSEIWLPHEAANGTITTGAINFSVGGNANSSGVGHNMTSFYLVMSEEDKNGNIGDGDNITLTLSWNGQSPKEPHVSAISGGEGTSTQIEDTKIYRNFVYSALATEILWDKTGDQYEADLVYHGEEAYGEVYLTDPSATVSEGTSATSVAQIGNVVFTDAEKASWSGENVIIVGGSCINSAAAEALGVPANTCGAAFTDATGVGSGQYLIQSVGDAFTVGKIALVVAGYSSDDTVAAASYLMNQAVDTATGKKYIGTSSTEATLQVEEA